LTVTIETCILLNNQLATVLYFIGGDCVEKSDEVFMHHWGDFMKDVIFDGKYAAAAGLRREQRDVTKLN